MTLLSHVIVLANKDFKVLADHTIFWVVGLKNIQKVNQKNIHWMYPICNN